jgi:hypothetical protein
MNQIVWPVLLNALLYAAVASTLSITAREFRLFNLAAGPILVAGGWLRAWLASGCDSQLIGINPWYFMLLLCPLVIQVGAPLVLKGTLKRVTSAYMFISIGGALFIESVGQNRLQSASGLTIPLQTSWWGNVIALLMACFALVVAEVTVHSSRWAKAVLDFRSCELGAKPWTEICRLIILELVLLLLIGACSCDAHKGEFGSGPYLTMIPLLAVLVGKGRPWRSFLLCMGISLATSVATLLLPGLAQEAVAFTILLLGICSIIASGVSLKPADIPSNDSFPEPLSGWAISKVHSYWTGPALALFGLAALFAPLLTTAPHFGSGASALNGYLVPLLWVIIAWIGQNYLGVESISWPIMAGTFAYGWAVPGHNLLAVSAVSAVMIVLWLGYIVLLRILPPRSRLIIDLTIATALYEAVVNSPFLSGENNLRQVVWLGPVEEMLPKGTTMLLILAVTLFAVSFVVSAKRYSRGVSLSLVNPRFGIRQGFSFFGPFVVFASCAVGATFVGELFNQLTTSSVTPERLQVGQVLPILLLSSVMKFGGGLVGTALVFLLYFVLVALYATQGVILNMWVGVCFVILGVLAR